MKNKFTLSNHKHLFLFVVFLFCLASCKKDDENTTNEIPANDYGEQHIIENDSIIDFMQNHFYNYEDFSNLGPGDAPELIIDSIKGNNSNKTSIYDQVIMLKAGEIMAKGNQQQVINSENLKKLYGIDLEVIKNNGLWTINRLSKK